MSIEADALRLVINVLRAAAELGDYTIAKCRRSGIAPPSSSGGGIEGFVTVNEFMRSMGLSHSSYRRLRREGRTPPEFRLSANTARISRAEIEKWRAQQPTIKGKKSKGTK